jgi:hypothetical protein
MSQPKLVNMMALSNFPAISVPTHSEERIPFAYANHGGGVLLQRNCAQVIEFEPVA